MLKRSPGNCNWGLTLIKADPNTNIQYHCEVIIDEERMA